MSRWFRHYAGMMRDDKLVRVAIRSRQSIERVLWVWGAILESAAEIDDGGRYDVDIAEVAYFLRADEADVCAVFDALAEAGRVADGFVVKWGNRQFQSDKSAARVAAYRERKRLGGGDGNEASQDGNGDVTLQKRPCNGPETETETETEAELAKANNIVRVSRASMDGFDAFWQAYPRREAKKQAARAWLKAVKTVPAATLVDAAKRYAHAKETTEKRFIKQPATWLNGGCWDDELYEEQSNVGNMGGRIGQGAGGGGQPLRGSRTMDFLRSVQRELEDERRDEGGDGGVSYSLALPGCG